ncbi:Putative ribonuclease H protein At1g65750 [Linum perenne]
MTVKRRQKKGTSNPPTSSQPKPNLGSRFTILAEEGPTKDPAGEAQYKGASSSAQDLSNSEELADAMKVVIDKALGKAPPAKVIGSKPTKAGSGKSVRNALANVTNVADKVPEAPSKNKASEEGLVNVPVMIANPIFQSGKTKLKTRPKAKTKENLSPPVTKTPKMSNQRKFTTRKPDAESKSVPSQSLLSNQVTEEHWTTLWRWHGPSRVKMFLWLTIHDRILTNAERSRRHMSQSAACSRCEAATKSVTHVLRDCHVAKETWSLLGFPQNSSFWQGSPRTWISCGLRSESSLLFGVTVWLIWKARNEGLFANTWSTPPQLASRIRT